MLPYNNLAIYLKVPKKQQLKALKNAVIFKHPTVVWRPHFKKPGEYSVKLYTHFCADSMG